MYCPKVNIISMASSRVVSSFAVIKFTSIYIVNLLFVINKFVVVLFVGRWEPSDISFLLTVCVNEMDNKVDLYYCAVAELYITKMTWSFATFQTSSI